MQRRFVDHFVLSLGMVLAILSSASASTFKVLYTFGASGNSDAYLPEGTLIMDQAGNLYGTTVAGGPYNGGTVFELMKNADGSWSEKILYSFTAGADGAQPLAAVVFDSEGNLYGTASQGGINNSSCSQGCGVVFKLTPGSNQWTETVLHIFSGMPDGAGPASALVIDPAGNLYGTTTYGGGGLGCYAGCGTVFELVKAHGWKERIVHTFGGPSDGIYPTGGLTIDAKGNLVGTTVAGGNTQNADGTVYLLKPNSKGSWTESILDSFCVESLCADGNGPAAGVTLVHGQIFGTTSMGGGDVSKYGVFFELSPGTSGWTEKDLPFDITNGADPLAPVLFRDGNFYGVTVQGGIQNGACTLYPDGNGVVYGIVPSGSTFKETVLYNFTGGSDGCAPVGGLVSDAAGNLYGTTFAGGGSFNGGVVFEVTP